MSSSKTVVVNKYHKIPLGIYIGRGSMWGNPFIIGKDGDRNEVIDKYEEWIKTQPQIIDNLSELKGKTLCCFCSPRRCHGDVLAKLADQL